MSTDNRIIICKLLGIHDYETEVVHYDHNHQPEFSEERCIRCNKFRIKNLRSNLDNGGKLI